MISPDRVEGCLLGLALGDALGAPFEGGLAERLLWKLVGRTREGHMRWTCVTALYSAVRFIEGSFEDLQAFVVSCGGDTDTIGSMAGAVWGASNGAARLPEAAVAKLERSAGLRQLATALHAHMST
jgi:ADP-ribosylglycohydrolase